jgi:hypothetical protein
MRPGPADPLSIAATQDEHARGHMSLRNRLARPYHRLLQTFSYLRHETSLTEHVTRGHYYSPLPFIDEAAAFASAAGALRPELGLPGIRLDAGAQRSRLAELSRFQDEFDWPSEKTAARRYYSQQGFLNEADAFTLFAVMRDARPRRIVEVGSGFSSAVMLDVREYKSEVPIDLTFIEPFPQRLEALLSKDDLSPDNPLGRTTLHRRRVQEIGLAPFEALKCNDILFIDSSHVAKTGSDVNYMMFEVLPRLAPGVLVHFHDIFWPFEYPPEWIRLGRSWNEAYLLRAFLMFNDAFDIYFWAPYATAGAEPETTRIYFRNGQSLWMRRRA